MTDENHVDAAVQTEWSLLTQVHRYGAIPFHNRPTSRSSGSGTVASRVPSNSNTSRSSGGGSTTTSGSSNLRTASLPIPTFRPSLTDLITAALSDQPAEAATSDMTPRPRVVTAPDALERVKATMPDSSSSSLEKSFDESSSITIHNSFETLSVPSSPESVELIGGMKSIPRKFRRSTLQTISEVSNRSPVTPVSELTGRRFTAELGPDGWVSWDHSPPRPIPALHGPLSLPYARCPSGAEGAIFNEAKDCERVVWGLGNLPDPLGTLPEAPFTPRPRLADFRHEFKGNPSARPYVSPRMGPGYRSGSLDNHKQPTNRYSSTHPPPPYGLGLIAPLDVSSTYPSGPSFGRNVQEPKMMSSPNSHFLSSVPNLNGSSTKHEAGLAPNFLDVHVPPPGTHLPTPPATSSPIWSSSFSRSDYMVASRPSGQQDRPPIDETDIEYRDSTQTERFRRFWADTQNLAMDAVQSRIDSAYESLLPGGELLLGNVTPPVAHTVFPSPPEHFYPAVLSPTEPKTKGPPKLTPRRPYPAATKVLKSTVRPLDLSVSSPGLLPRPGSPQTLSNDNATTKFRSNCSPVSREVNDASANDYRAFRSRLVGLLSPSSTIPSIGLPIERLQKSPRRQPGSSNDGPMMKNFKSVPMTRLVDRHNHCEASPPRRLHVITEEFETTPSRSREFFPVPLASSFQDISNVPIESRSSTLKAQTKTVNTLDSDVDDKPKIRLPSHAKELLVNEDEETENGKLNNVRTKRGGKGRQKSRIHIKR